jgi:serine protease AprX
MQESQPPTMTEREPSPASPSSDPGAAPPALRPGLPPDFYRGRAKARRAALLALVVVLGSFAVLIEAHVIEASALLGPHVARSEWAFTMTGVRDLHAMGLTGRGVTVCLVDSGIDLLHPDFAHLRLVAWKDLVNLRPEPYDDGGHGTAMAGLIAANGSLHGIAPDVSFLVVKVITSAGFGSSTEVADGIRFCLDPFGDGTRGADVISISLGSKNPLFVATDVSRAAQLALDRGVFVIASAGNNGLSIDNTDVEIPANVPLAIAVGAVDSGGRIAPFSSIGADANRTDPNRKPEVVAPGVQVITTAPGAHYVTSSGTSPATAIVAGVVALLLQARPGLKPAGTTANILLLKWALVRSSTAGPGQVLPHDARYGYGIISGNRALSYL